MLKPGDLCHWNEGMRICKLLSRVHHGMLEVIDPDTCFEGGSLAVLVRRYDGKTFRVRPGWIVVDRFQTAMREVIDAET